MIEAEGKSSAVVAVTRHGVLSAQGIPDNRANTLGNQIGGMMTTRGELESELHETGVRFVIGELDRALSFLYVAGTSSAIEKRRQCCRDAESAYVTAQSFLPGIPLTGSQEAAIGAMQRQIKHRLDRFKIID
jgi:enoyl reductase-like protein